MEIDIETIFRMSHVKRWHIVKTCTNQTLAEHSFTVTMLVCRFTELLEIDDGKVSALSNYVKLSGLIRYALIHDVPETKTGDIPTPIKRKINNDIEKGFFEEYDKLKMNLDHSHEFLLKLIKLADLFDAVRFLQEEGIGPKALFVMESLKQRMFNLLYELKKSDFGSTLDWTKFNKEFKL